MKEVIFIGNWVWYKANAFVALNSAVSSETLVQIINPYAKNANVKLNVKASNLAVLDMPNVTSIHYRDAEYFVTLDSVIISRTSGKVMAWGSEHGSRIAILDMVNSRVTDSERYCKRQYTVPKIVGPDWELKYRQLLVEALDNGCNNDALVVARAELEECKKSRIGD